MKPFLAPKREDLRERDGEDVVWHRAYRVEILVLVLLTIMAVCLVIVMRSTKIPSAPPTVLSGTNSDGSAFNISNQGG